LVFQSSKENRPTVSGNKMMREKVWPKREKITGNWRKLHSEELQGYYSSSNTPTYYSNNEITLVRPRRRWR